MIPIVPRDLREKDLYVTVHPALGEVAPALQRYTRHYRQASQRTRHQAPRNEAKGKKDFIYFLGGDGGNTMSASPKAFLSLSCLYLTEFTITSSMVLRVMSGLVTSLASR